MSLADLKPLVPSVVWDTLPIGIDETKRAARFLRDLTQCVFGELERRCKHDQHLVGGLALARLCGLENSLDDLWTEHRDQKRCGEKIATELPTLQALFLTVDASGGLNVGESAPRLLETLGSVWAKETWNIAMLAAALTSMRSYLLKGTHRIGFHDDEMIVCAEQAILNLLDEQSRNRRAYEQVLGPIAANDELLAPREASVAIRDELSFGFDDIMSLLQNGFHSTWKTATLGPLVLVDPAKLESTQKLLLSAFSLDFETVRRYKEAFWFRLAPERKSSSEGAATILADACLERWMHHFPILRVMLPGGNIGGLVLPRIYYALMSAINQSKARILERLIARSDSSTAAKWKQRVHQQQEEKAAAVFRSRGWKVIEGVKRHLRKDLPCGEIDVLSGFVVTGEPLVVVGEVKDFDLSVDRELDFVKHGNAMKLASEQLDRKKLWVEKHSRLVSEWLGIAPPFRCLAWVIGARYIAPPFAGKFPLIPIHGLDKELERLERGKHLYWWRPHDPSPARDSISGTTTTQSSDMS